MNMLTDLCCFEILWPGKSRPTLPPTSPNSPALPGSDDSLSPPPLRSPPHSAPPAPHLQGTRPSLKRFGKVPPPPPHTQFGFMALNREGEMFYWQMGHKKLGAEGRPSGPLPWERPRSPGVLWEAECCVLPPAFLQTKATALGQGRKEEKLKELGS